MTRLVLILLSLTLQAFAQEAKLVQWLDVGFLADSVKSAKPEEKVLNVRMFLKTSGENWEKVRKCGGSGLSSRDWLSTVRMNDLLRAPKGPDEALALRLANESIQAAANGDTARYNEIRRQLELLGPKLLSCGIDFSAMTPELMTTLIETRVAVGAELKKAFLNHFVWGRKKVIQQLLGCQMQFRISDDPSLECYRFMIKDETPEKQEYALSLVKESAILTLLMERNQNPPCSRVPEMTAEQSDFYQVGNIMSPLFDMEKDSALVAHLSFCSWGKK